MNTVPNFRRALALLPAAGLAFAGTALAQESPDIVWEVDGHTASANAVAFSSDGLTVASGADYPDSTAKVWRSADGTQLYDFPGHDGGVLSVDLSADGQSLAAGYIVVGYPPGGSMELWDISAESVLDTFGGCHVAFSADSEFVASGGCGVNRYLALHRVSNRAQIWNSYTGAYILDVAYSPDGVIVASSGSDNNVKLWDAKTGDLIRALTGHTDNVSTIAFSPDGQMLASGAGGFDDEDESTIKLWRVSDGQLLRTLEGHGQWVLAVDFVPGGQFLVSSGRESSTPYRTEIKFWRVSDGELHLSYDEQALDIAYSPDGMVFAYGRADGTVVVARSPIVPEPGDLDGDSDVDSADLAMLLGAWGPCAPCPPHEPADLDQDCRIGTADLALLLGSWSSP